MTKYPNISENIVSLPKGGAAFKPIDEMFKTDLSTGSGFYQVSISLPRGINDLTPSVILSYSSGHGNGHFGMGWAIHGARIIRSSKASIPSFNDDQDIFSFDSRELIHVGDDLYQPEVESEFLRIKREKTNESWEIQTKNGLKMILGSTENSRLEVGITGSKKIQQWLLAEIIDSNGNIINYKYLKDDDEIYLKSIEYAIYKLDFIYEEREDAHSDYRSGFEIRTNLRCKSIDLYLLKPQVQPIKSYRFRHEYSEFSRISLLKEIGLVALNKKDNGDDNHDEPVEETFLPPITFEYTKFDPTSKKCEIFKDSNSPPPNLSSRDVTLIDFEGSGLPGILEMKGGTARFWSNNGGLVWSSPKTIKEIPLRADLGHDNLVLADMDGNGMVDLLVTDRQTSGYFPGIIHGWSEMVRYSQSPSFALNDPNSRLLDINGDGKIDMMHSDEKAFYYYINNGNKGWQFLPILIRRIKDLEKFPDVDLSDYHIRLADVVGDGRSHLVQVYSGRIVYWPNLGNGRWGSMRRIKNAPILPTKYDPNRLFLVDIDGDGLSDIVYVDYDRVYCWLNQSGNSFSDLIEIKGTPPIANAAIVIADLKGTGTNGIMWSFPDALRKKTAYRYLDLTGGIKPYLLNSITNNMKINTRILYGTSSEFANDKIENDEYLAGKDYFLPFPIHVVKEIQVEDPSRQITTNTMFRYICGNYDSNHRRFLGFAKAERIEIGDSTQPTTRFTSYFNNHDIFLKGLPYFSATYAQDTAPIITSKPYITEEDEYEIKTVKVLPSGKSIKFIAKTMIRTKNYERSDHFNELVRKFKYDQFGNRIEEIKESSWIDHDGNTKKQIVKIGTEYAQNISTWLVGLPFRVVTRDIEGKILAGKIIYYDGPSFQGLPLGEVEKGNTTRERHLVLTESMAEEVYEAVPDMAALGYIKDTDSVLGEAFYIDKLSQKFDLVGNSIERSNARGKTTVIKFDEHHIYPIEIISPHGLTTKIKYEYRYGSVVSHSDFNNNQTEYTYDKVGRLTAVKRQGDSPENPYLEFRYSNVNDPHRFILTLTRENTGFQHKRLTYLDGMGEVLQVRSEAEDEKVVVSGQKLSNSKGQLIGETYPYFSNTLDLEDNAPDTEKFMEYHYDALGRSTLRKDIEDNIFKTEYKLSSKWDYDSFDLLNDSTNLSFDTPKTEWFDADNRLVTIVERTKDKQLLTHYTYDVLGRRVEARNDGSVLLENTFDCLGRRIRSKYRDAGIFTYLYDATDNIIERKDGKGDVLYRKYDDLNRVLEMRFGGSIGDLQESYFYDQGDPEENPKGHLTKVTGPSGEIEYGYTCCNRMKRKTCKFPGQSQTMTVQYDLDALGRIKQVIYPDGFTVDFKYNKGGLLASITGIINKISYGPTGKRTKIEYANGVKTELVYDKSFRLQKRVTTSADGTRTIQDLSHTYDLVGNILAISDEANIQGHIKNDRHFKYDEIYQLIEDSGANSTGHYLHNYKYDEVGNIVEYPEEFGSAEILHEDTTKPYQVTGIKEEPDKNFEYDLSGNLIKTPIGNFSFDAKNRLIKIIHKDGTTIDFLYDHHGARVVTKITKNGNTQTTFNFDDIYFITGTKKQRVVFDEIGPVALVNEDGTGAIFHKDHLGSHTAQSDLQTGTFLGEESYYAYGKISFNNMPNIPFHYNGKIYEQIPGLQFFGGRDYFPSLGRFLTPDPLFLEQQPEKFFKSPRSLRLYNYVLNNPLNIIDPEGLWFGIDDLIVAGVGFVVGVAAYLISSAVNGTSVNFGEMLLAGVAGAFTGWFIYNTLGLGAAILVGAARLTAPAITGALDQASMGDSFGERFLGFLSFALKFASSPVTSTVGLIIGGFGTGFGLWGDVEWFKGGVIAFEYSPTSTFSAVTLGATMNIWGGSTKDPLFNHELYHSRQYTYFGDTFVPLWVVGGVYGLISSAIAGNFQWSCFNSSNPNAAYGNPLEDGAHEVERGGGCT
jgi:RHS repeat-associated protein